MSLIEQLTIISQIKPKGGEHPRDTLNIASIDGVSDKVYAYSRGGGAVTVIPFETIDDHYELVPPNTPTTFRRSWFYIHEGTPVMGYTDDQRWNGWAKPHFESEEANQVLRLYGNSLTWRYDGGRDEYVYHLESTDLDADTTDHVSPGHGILVDGQPKHVYAIGDGWAWEELTARDIAVAFSELITDTLTTSELSMVIARNAEESIPEVCHSHDFCDANVVMEKAFKRHRLEMDPTNEPLATLWSQAWNLAKKADFTVERLKAAGAK